MEEVVPSDVHVVASKDQVLVLHYFSEDPKGEPNDRIRHESTSITKAIPPTELCISKPRVTASIAARYLTCASDV